jgi:uncharacterized protein YdhG (YjbR/CyaY superfamily)
MTVAEVSAYIDAQAEPKRTTLLAMRELILEVESGLEQVIAWGSPAFKFGGQYVVGLCAFKNHLTLSPQSAEVMAAYAVDLADYVVSKSSFQFGVDAPLPKSLVEKLVKARLAEIS